MGSPYIHAGRHDTYRMDCLEGLDDACRMHIELQLSTKLLLLLKLARQCGLFLPGQIALNC